MKRGLRGLRGCGFGGCGETLEARDGLLDGLHEAGEGDRLEQVIDSIDLVAFEGIFAVGGGEDDGGHALEGARKLDAVEVGHVDVEENDIDMMLLAEAEGLEGVLGGACELEFGYLADVVLEEFASQEFVIDNQYIIHILDVEDGFVVGVVFDDLEGALVAEEDGEALLDIHEADAGAFLVLAADDG